ncbi:MAG: hypothetical protein CM15mP120_06400 [Pseudomonadota bacterium]|nr:MAG: hypothetical protein CM15mP120_06400 [Pseudomonadota bacterium]
MLAWGVKKVETGFDGAAEKTVAGGSPNPAITLVTPQTDGVRTPARTILQMRLNCSSH